MRDSDRTEKKMSLLELGEMFLWFCLSAAITTVGVLAALLGIALNYFAALKAQTDIAGQCNANRGPI